MFLVPTVDFCLTLPSARTDFGRDVIFAIV